MNVIELNDVSKKFKVYHGKTVSFKYAVIDFVKGKRSSDYDEFWALKNINIDIKGGETVGLIGVNSSGKSTLLKLIGKILYPDVGHISTRGRIATLIELGAGFHPELTGRENIYINASILGFSKTEIDEKFDEIIGFSELEKFIDNPIKSYSSGMYVRLGFAVAINVNPDILLTDEILAVGDENFQKKCLNKIEEFKKNGKTIVYVSHDLGSVERICDRVLLLDNGELVLEGRSVDVISEYHRVLIRKNGQQLGAIEESEAASTQKDSEFVEEAQKGKASLKSSNGSQKRRWGTKEAEITKVTFLDKNDQQTNVFKIDEKLKVRIDYIAHTKIESPVFGVGIHRDDGIHVTGPNTKTSGYLIEEIEGEGFIEYIIENVRLVKGRYFLTAAIYEFSCDTPYDHWEQSWSFHIIENKNIGDRYGLISIPCTWRHHGRK
jgi:ABC-type polysaccharide/polyol phosphate transport system ATPase subunit